MSTIDDIHDEDSENIFAGDSSSSENEMVNVENRPMARKSLPLKTWDMNNWAPPNSKQTPTLGKACKPNDENCASNSCVKVLNLPLPQNSTDLEKSRGINASNSSIKVINLPLPKNNIDLEKSPGIQRKSTFVKIYSVRTDSAGRQMLNNNNQKLQTIANKQTLSTTRKIFSLFDEIRSYESDEEDKGPTAIVKVSLFNDSDQENETTILDIADAENHLKNKTLSADKSRTSSKKSDEATSNLNIQELIKDQKLPPMDIESDVTVTRKRKDKPWDQLSFLAEGENVFIPADNLIQTSGMVDLVPDLNHLDLSGKISDHFKFSGWSISHLSLEAACQVLQNPENRPRTPNKTMLNQLIEEASFVKVERIDMKNCTLGKDSEDRGEAITESNTKLSHQVTPRKQKDSWELSSSQFAELFGLRLKSVAEMKTGFVGHKARRLRKRPNKYSPS